MFVYEPMSPLDIFSMDIANLDAKSENFTLEYYLYYLEHHPDHFITIKRSDPGWAAAPLLPQPVVGYIFGKTEVKTQLCMHISALSIAPAYRTVGLGSALLQLLERNGDALGAHFSDLYVRSRNDVAIAFYRRKGYVLYRRVLDYYAGPIDDAWDMRKPLRADPSGISLAGGKDIHGYEL